jgi:hypothetical protein
MYRIGRGVKKSSRRHVYKILVVSLLVAVASGSYWLYIFMQGGNDESITPQSIIREYAPPQTTTHKTFDTAEFHMELPNDWVLKEHQTNPYNLYAYQAGNKGADNRWVEIYVDAVPPKPVNRLRLATITNGVLAPTDQMSDNCYESAGNKPVAQQTFKGVNFQCDVADYSRNVVGVGAVGQGTVLKLGGHKFTILYIDHNVRPSYQILDDMLTSFSVK